MQIVYAREALPDRWTKSLFLAGPTPRKDGPDSWRPEALRLLESLGYDGVVFVPEDRDMNGCGVSPETYEPQIRWEDEAMRRADVIVFWVAREIEKMPAFTTNIEWGEYFDSGKVALGWPEKAPKVGYFKTKAEWQQVPVAHALEETLKRALEMIGEGAPREGGETWIPISVWRTPVFRRWHAAQKAAGNTLLSARVHWTYRIGREKERLLFWAIETDMRVGAENRVVKDGLVIGRPDLSVTILLGPDRGFQTQVVMIREFRPAAITTDGCVHESPGGSSWEDLSPVEVAAAEVAEEAGIVLTPTRFKSLGQRQLLSTLCAHRADVFMARLTGEELEKLRRLEGRPLGREREGERTYVEFTTYRELFEGKSALSRDLDYATLGMLYSAFYTLV